MYNKELQLAIKEAKKVGKILLRNLGKSTFSIKGYSNKDWVTNVDHIVEETLIKAIKRHFPTHQILAEEGGMAGPLSEFKWLIDPIDGTGNYHKGWPFFGISIALQKQGKTVLGVVYNPVADELFYAVKGGGAFLNKRRIHVSKHTREIGGLGVMEFGSKKLVQHKFGMRVLDSLRGSSFKVRLSGCASLDMCYTAAGRADFCLLLDMWPWDVAASVLIASEAGGKVIYFSKGSNKVKVNRNALTNVNVLVGNRQLCRKIISHLPKSLHKV